MAFHAGISGLHVFAKGLDVVSHNIANASTVGFKGSEAHFADVYAGALNGIAATQIGIGSRLMAVQQNFTQGNISTTGNGLDMAINGNGFFRFQKTANDSAAYYSRNGQFHLNNKGLIENSNGYLLTGFGCKDGVNVDYASIVPLSVGNASIPPEQTGWSTLVNFGGGGGLLVGVNLDRRDVKALDNSADPTNWTALQPLAWDSSFSSDMFNYSTSATVYDQSGTPHMLTNYFVRAGATGEDERTWRVYTAIDGDYMAAVATGTEPATLPGPMIPGPAIPNPAYGPNPDWDPTNPNPGDPLYAGPEFGIPNPAYDPLLNPGDPNYEPRYIDGPATIPGPMIPGPPIPNPAVGQPTYEPRYYELVFNYNGTLDRIQDPFDPINPTQDIGSWYGLDLHTTIKRSPVEITNPNNPNDPPILLEGPVMVDLMRENASFPLYYDNDSDPTTVTRTALPPGYNTVTLNKPWFRETTATSTNSPVMAAFRMDLSTSTQFGIPFDVMATRQDGYLPGNLSSISISQTGHLVAGYSNGQTKVLGQVLLAEFDNPHGLQSAGDNLWIETWDSGQPTIGNPGGGTRGIIIGQSVEESNVDMTQELVNMIIYQRNYQANAQTIRTQDQILQTLVNLR